MGEIRHHGAGAPRGSPGCLTHQEGARVAKAEAGEWCSGWGHPASGQGGAQAPLWSPCEMQAVPEIPLKFNTLNTAGGLETELGRGQGLQSQGRAVGPLRQGPAQPSLWVKGPRTPRLVCHLPRLSVPSQTVGHHCLPRCSIVGPTDVLGVTLDPPSSLQD